MLEAPKASYVGLYLNGKPNTTAFGASTVEKVGKC